jgi:hypothetical protein
MNHSIPAKMAAHGKLRIFIVDGEPHIQHLIRTTVQKEDREIHAFSEVATRAA